MLEEILALNLLFYIILNMVHLNVSKERFDKLVYHSALTRIIATVVSIIGSATIILGLSVFIWVWILSFTRSGLLETTLIEIGWEYNPLMLFLTLIGALTLMFLPVGISYVLPIFGTKKKVKKSD